MHAFDNNWANKEVQKSWNSIILMLLQLIFKQVSSDTICGPPLQLLCQLLMMWVSSVSLNVVWFLVVLLLSSQFRLSSVCLWLTDKQTTDGIAMWRGCPLLRQLNFFAVFYRATHMHSADYAVTRCLFVHPSVRPSHAGILSKRLNISSKFFHLHVARPS